MSPLFIKGIIFALIACFIWGLIFVVPLFMEGFTPIEIIIGRYLIYGVISLGFLLKLYLINSSTYSFNIWVKAIGFSFTCTVGYYTFVILSLRYSSPAICTLILGISPMTIAFYGNWKEKQYQYQSLIVPFILVLVGLLLVNIPCIIGHDFLATHMIGLACAFWAVISWTWYVVANAAFLKSHREIDSADWSALIGIGSLFWIVLLSIVVKSFFWDELDWNKYITPSSQLLHFFIGCLVLGVMCSWIGACLWNLACLYLPVSLAGQLTIFETLFGLLFVYAFEHRFPSFLECLGMVLLFGAVLYALLVSHREVGSTFHQPHPKKETDKGALVSVRRFLENAGLIP